MVTSVQATNNKITQNETLTTNNDSQLSGIQAGLALPEAQVNTNAAATAQLRTDVHYAVATVVQETQRPITGVQTSGTAPESDMQMMRNKIDEFGRKRAHEIEAERTRTNEIMQSVEALVGCQRIQQVHQQLAKLDKTIAHMSSTFGSRADDSDRHLHELIARVANMGHGSP